MTGATRRLAATVRVPERMALAGLVLWVGWRLWTIAVMPAHPDPREDFIAQEILRARDGLAPTVYNWPGTPWVRLLALLSWIGGVDGVEGIVGLGRVCAMAFSAVTLVVVWALSRRLEGGGWAWLAPVTLAASPCFSTAEGNLALVDHPALALALLGVLVSTGQGARRGQYAKALTALLAGILVGVGGAVKFTSLLAAAPVCAIAVGCSKDSPGRIALTVCGVGLGVLVGFGVGCPYVFTEPSAVFAGLAYEAGHYHKGHFGLIATGADGPLSGLHRHVVAMQWAGGALLAPVALVLAALGLVRRRAWTVARVGVAVWLALLLGTIVIHKFSFPRHWLTALAPMFLLVGVALGGLSPRWRLVGAVVLLLAVVRAGATTVALDWLARRPSTIEQCERWVRDAVEVADRPLTVTAGPDAPILRWLYPPVSLEGQAAGAARDADLVVVASLEAELQTAIEDCPAAYNAGNFFPLTRAHFTTGRFHRGLDDRRPVVGQCSVELPGWMRAALFWGRPLPFPWNALHHPTLMVYGLPVEPPSDRVD